MPFEHLNEGTGLSFSTQVTLNSFQGLVWKAKREMLKRVQHDSWVLKPKPNFEL